MTQEAESRGEGGSSERPGWHVALRSHLPATTILTLILVGLSLSFGVFLRLVRWSEWPPGPWVDEAYALRAARIAAASGQPLFGTSPLTPLDEGFVNYYCSNLYLGLTARVDGACGGGLLTLRVLSIGPALLVLLASSLLAWQLLGPRRIAFLSCVLWLSASFWLLTNARWGWVAVSTTLLLVIAASTLTVALERGGLGWSVASGLALGLSQYGYIAAWLTLPVPLLMTLTGLIRWRKTRGSPAWKAPLLAFVTAFLVVAPLAAHLVKNPERAFARTREVTMTRLGIGELPGMLAKNSARYALLFVTGGDPNERHGDPKSPVLPPLVAGLALAGLVVSFCGNHPARCTALFALLLLAGGLASYDPGGANSFRISPAAPFLIVLAGVGLKAVLERLPRKRAGLITAAVAAAVIATAAGEASGFLIWTSSDRTRGVFGGPERELSDVFSEFALSEKVTLVMEPRAVRNLFVVDTLVARPDSAGQPAVKLVFPESTVAWRFIPSGKQILALSSQPDRRQFALSLGARPLFSGGVIEGFPGFTIYELSPDQSEAVARHVSNTSRLSSIPSGNFEAREAGVHEFKSKGPGQLRIDGHPLPSGNEWARSFVFLEQGFHELTWHPGGPQARLVIVAPDGYAIPLVNRGDYSPPLGARTTRNDSAPHHQVALPGGGRDACAPRKRPARERPPGETGKTNPGNRLNPAWISLNSEEIRLRALRTTRRPPGPERERPCVSAVGALKQALTGEFDRPSPNTERQPIHECLRHLPASRLDNAGKRRTRDTHSRGRLLLIKPL